MAVKKITDTQSANLKELAKAMRAIQAEKAEAEKRAIAEGVASLLQSTRKFKINLETFLTDTANLHRVVNIDGSVNITKEDLKAVLEGCDRTFRRFVLNGDQVEGSTDSNTRKVIAYQHEEGKTLLEHCKKEIEQFFLQLGCQPKVSANTEFLTLRLAEDSTGKKKKL